MCCDNDDGYGACSVSVLESDLEQARDAIRYLRAIAFEDHDYEFGSRESCKDTCKVCDAKRWFDWNFN